MFSPLVLMRGARGCCFIKHSARASLSGSFRCPLPTTIKRTGAVQARDFGTSQANFLPTPMPDSYSASPRTNRLSPPPTKRIGLILVMFPPAMIPVTVSVVRIRFVAVMAVGIIVSSAAMLTPLMFVTLATRHRQQCPQPHQTNDQFHGTTSTPPALAGHREKPEIPLGLLAPHAIESRAVRRSR